MRWHAESGLPEALLLMMRHLTLEGAKESHNIVANSLLIIACVMYEEPPPQIAPPQRVQTVTFEICQQVNRLTHRAELYFAHFTLLT